MKTNWLITALLFLLIICTFSCKKNSDYRDDYIGNYNFAVNEHIFHFNDSTISDTLFNYSGSISKGTNADEIIIYYRNDGGLPVVLTKSGELQEPPYIGFVNYSISGRFESYSKISLRYFIYNRTDSVIGIKR